MMEKEKNEKEQVEKERVSVYEQERIQIMKEAAAVLGSDVVNGEKVVEVEVEEEVEEENSENSEKENSEEDSEDEDEEKKNSSSPQSMLGTGVRRVSINMNQWKNSILPSVMSSIQQEVSTEVSTSSDSQEHLNPANEHVLPEPEPLSPLLSAVTHHDQIKRLILLHLSSTDNGRFMRLISTKCTIAANDRVFLSEIMRSECRSLVNGGTCDLLVDLLVFFLFFFLVFLGGVHWVHWNKIILIFPLFSFTLYS